MSLDDRFNPNDGSSIDRMDNALFELSKKLAKKWQDHTGHNKHLLEEILYSGSVALFGTNAVQTGSINMAILAGIIGLKLVSHAYKPIRTSALEEQMSAEACGLPTKTPKVANLAVCYVGLVSVLGGVAHLAAGTIASYGQQYFEAARDLNFGIGTLAWLTADYMAQSDIGTPPPKKPILERMKELMGRLVPRLAPAYSASPNFS